VVFLCNIPCCQPFEAEKALQIAGLGAKRPLDQSWIFLPDHPENELDFLAQARGSPAWPPGKKSTRIADVVADEVRRPPIGLTGKLGISFAIAFVIPARHSASRARCAGAVSDQKTFLRSVTPGNALH
jgi:hypothetical protein